MAKHQLYLDFPPTTNEGILRVDDISIYNSLIPVDCAALEITPPSYTTPTVLTNLTEGFRLVLNACTTGILTTGCDSACPKLPDGIWHYRYSVSPNTKVYVEYDQLRIVATMNKYYKALCWINDKPCDPTNEKLVLIRELQTVKSQIFAAKSFVEDLHDPDTGMQMFLYARKKLDELSRGCHTCH